MPKKREDIRPGEGFFLKLEVERDKFPHARYPFNLPCLKDLDVLELSPTLTCFVGENGSGKSTLLEAIAVKQELNAEGGGRNFRFATHETHSNLADFLRMPRQRNPRDTFFLRAESYYNVATELHKLNEVDGGAFGAYGGSPHERSHGESFLALFDNRLGTNGFYLVDEPEAALSPQRQMALLLVMRRLIDQGCQFIIATHSPIILAYPGALIYEFSEDGVRRIDYEDAECVRITKGFLENPGRYLQALFGSSSSR